MPVFNVSFDISKLKSGASDAITIVDKVAEGFDKVDKNSSKASTAMGAVSSTAQTAAGKIKSLAAQIVDLITVYKALEAAKNFVKKGFDFSASLEASEISIASVISATNNISTAQGKVLAGAEKFNAAQSISKDMMKEIQALALQSTATFESLADGVAGIIAPATKAGVSLEKLPKFAVQAAQAMTTMRIPVQQMRTEIESLLSGNINKAQDLLATNLGITEEMVKNWQKQGTLVDELNKRFEAFVIARAKVADSWSGLRSNMEDAFQYLSGTTGKGIFEGAKQAYRELLDLMVSTKGEVGVGKDLENIMGLITEIQDAIGSKLLSATREFIDELRGLNEPENVAGLKQHLNDVWENLKDIGTAVKGAGELVGGVISNSLSGWNSMPDIIKELGIVGAVAFGWKGRAALVALGYATEKIGELMSFASVGSGGADAYKEYWKNKGKETSSNVVFSAENDDFSDAYDRSKSARYTTSSAIGGFDNQKKKTGKTDAERFAESSSQYEAGLRKLRNEIEALEAASNPALATFDRLRAQIEAEKDAAILNADVKKAETIRRKQATAAQAEETAALEKREAQLKANIKLDDLESKNAKERADFYQDLSKLTGDYSTSIEYQNKLLEKQAKEWDALGVPMDDIQERLKLMRLELARDAWSGATRGLQRYVVEAQDSAKQTEQIAYKAMGNIEDSLTSGLAKSFKTGVSFFDEMMTDIIRIAAVRPITVQLAGVASGALGTVLGTGTTAAAAGTAAGGNGLVSNAVGLVPWGSLTPSSWTGGITSTINSWGASAFPSLFGSTVSPLAGIANSVGTVANAVGGAGTHSLARPAASARQPTR